MSFHYSFHPLRISLRQLYEALLLTFQTALDFQSMTSYNPCLDWTPSELLNCYCHNPFHTVQQNKAFVSTVKAEAGWNIEMALSLPQCSLAEHNRSCADLKAKGQQPLGFCANSVDVLRACCWQVGLRHCKICLSGWGYCRLWPRLDRRRNSLSLR